MFKNVIRKYEIGMRCVEIRQELSKLGFGNFYGVYHKDKLLKAIGLGDELYDLTVELREIFREEGNKKAMMVEDQNLAKIENNIWSLKMDYELGCYLP